MRLRAVYRHPSEGWDLRPQGRTWPRRDPSLRWDDERAGTHLPSRALQAKGALGPRSRGDNEKGWEAERQLTGVGQRLADIPIRATMVSCVSQISKLTDGALMMARVITRLRQRHFGYPIGKGEKALNPETLQS